MKTTIILLISFLMIIPISLSGTDSELLKIVNVDKDIQIYLSSAKKNNYLCSLTAIRDGQKVLLIDSGYREDAELVIKDLNKRNLKVVKLILSHTHEDHVGGYKLFKDAETYASEHYSKDLNMTLDDVKDFKPDHLLKEGDKIEFGRHTISILHTPGHCISGISCHINKKIVHVGDLIFFTKDNRLAIPYLGGKISSYQKSLQRLRELRPEMIIPGHGEHTKNLKDSQDKIDRIAFYIDRFNAGNKEVKLSECIKPGTDLLSFELIHGLNIKKHKKQLSK